MKGVETVKIDKIPAGREMDELIAIEVMGWRKHFRNTAWWVPAELENESIQSPCQIMGMTCEEHRFAPSTDILAAWEVMEKITEKHWKFKLRRLPGKDYMAYFQNLLRFPIECESAPSGTAPLAICRAALKVVLGSDET